MKSLVIGYAALATAGLAGLRATDPWPTLTWVGYSIASQLLLLASIVCAIREERGNSRKGE